VPTKRAKPPTVRLRRLAAELRRLRSAAQLSRENVEEQTGVNEGTLYRLETARARPQRRTLMALLDLYGADASLRSDLLAIAQGADNQGWLRPYHSALPEEYTAYISFEAEARSVRNYESLFIPGLLQTEAYARAVIPGVQPGITKDQVDQRVQARIERQQLLDRDDPLELWAVIDEAAIRRLVGGREIMHAQVTHLTDTAAKPNITIQVIPFEAGAHPGMPGSFVHMDFKDPLDPELVYIDTMAGDLFLEADADLRHYRSMFDHLRATALSATQTGNLLASVAASMKGG
jgi:transcriptional regulator with XRE-family HTH domain